MAVIGKEATNFVRVCEAIQSLLASGVQLAPDDRDLIEFTAIDLLSKLKPASNSEPHNGSSPALASLSEP